MTDADRKRLVALLGMLGSAHAGERAAAGLQAEAFRRKHGLMWEQIISGEVVYVYREVPVYRDREVVIDREVVVETVVDRPVPMPLVQSIVTTITEPFPCFFLSLIAVAASMWALAHLGG